MQNIPNRQADLYAGAIFIKKSFNFDLYSSLCILLVVACIFTALGGLPAVIWTDAVQVGIMILGGFILMIMSTCECCEKLLLCLGFIQIGGYNELYRKYMTNFNAPPVPPTANEAFGFNVRHLVSILVLRTRSTATCRFVQSFS